MLAIQEIDVFIQASHILRRVSLEVREREVVCLVGRNGAGKTTTLRTIMGLWHASQGTVRFGSKDITALHTPQIAELGIAYVPENMGIFSDLTVKENMLLAARDPVPSVLHPLRQTRHGRELFRREAPGQFDSPIPILGSKQFIDLDRRSQCFVCGWHFVDRSAAGLQERFEQRPHIAIGAGPQIAHERRRGGVLEIFLADQQLVVGRDVARPADVFRPQSRVGRQCSEHEQDDPCGKPIERA